MNRASKNKATAALIAALLFLGQSVSAEAPVVAAAPVAVKPTVVLIKGQQKTKRRPVASVKTILGEEGNDQPGIASTSPLPNPIAVLDQIKAAGTAPDSCMQADTLTYGGLMERDAKLGMKPRDQKKIKACTNLYKFVCGRTEDEKKKVRPELVASWKYSLLENNATAKLLSEPQRGFVLKAIKEFTNREDLAGSFFEDELADYAKKHKDDPGAKDAGKMLADLRKHL
jgi:hypothetical protein